jgi:hypothetical protein
MLSFGALGGLACGPSDALSAAFADSPTPGPAVLGAGSDWQNPAHRFDVSGAEGVTPLDALLVGHALNNAPDCSLPAPPAAPPPYLDVDGDGWLTPSDYHAVVNYINQRGSGPAGEGPVAAESSEAMVQVRLATFDTAGNPLAGVGIGETFDLRIYVQDQRPDPKGVGAAYLDILYRSGVVAVAGEVAHVAPYTVARSGAASVAGLMDEVGGALDLFNPPAGELLLATIRFQAVAFGIADFHAEAADFVPCHPVLVLGSDTPVAAENIVYGAAQVPVTGVADDQFTVAEDGTLTRGAADGVLANDGLLPGMVAVLTDTPDRGELTFAADGAFTYTPAADFHGQDTFAYKAQGGGLETRVATVTVTVEPRNDPPVAKADEYQMVRGSSLQVSAADGVLANDMDVDGEVLTASRVTDPSHGTLTLLADGSFSYRPDGAFAGDDTFTYRAQDAAGSGSEATVTLHVYEPTVRMRVAVVDPNTHAPLATVYLEDEFLVQVWVEDLRAVPEGVFAAYVDVLYNAGRLSIAGPIAYELPYVNAAQGDTGTPGVIDEAGAAAGSEPLGGGEFLLFAVPLTARAEGATTLTLNPADVLPGHAVLHYNSPLPVLPSRIAFVDAALQIQVPPVAALDDLFDVDEDSVDTPLDVLLNDTGSSGGQRGITAVGPTSAGGAVVIADGGAGLSYTPAANFFGEETFTYTIDDGLGHTDQGRVTVHVHNVNDAPTANDDAFLVWEASGENELRVLANDATGPDPAETLQIVSVTAPDKGGSARIAVDGTRLLYTSDEAFGFPANQADRMEHFQYEISDGHGGTATGTVTIDVRPNWHNVDEPCDIDASGIVIPLDALCMIDYLNNNDFSHPLPNTPHTPGRLFLDVDGDGYAVPRDALFIIDYLNRQSAARGGEGEADLATPAAFTNRQAYPLPVPTVLGEHGGVLAGGAAVTAVPGTSPDWPRRGVALAAIDATRKEHVLLATRSPRQSKLRWEVDRAGLALDGPWQLLSVDGLLEELAPDVARGHGP